MIVQEEETTLRLDRLLAERFSGYSRTYFQYLIEQGCVLVNGRKLKKREKPKAGDEIDVCFILTPEISLEPQDIPLDIIYEDDDLLVVNKQAGLVVHPAPGHPSHTFVNALLFHCKQLSCAQPSCMQPSCAQLNPSCDSLRPGIVHRLDKDTTGILLAAKTSAAHQALIASFSKREIKKFYLAVAIGNPGSGIISAPIKRHPIKRQEMTVVEEGGREAISHCRVLSQKGDLTLVEIELITGRTHQIRVHLKHRGAPVLGDTLYGSSSANQRYGATRQLLHAQHIHLMHPITREPLRFEAPLPDDMQKIVDQIKE
ncbi:MAG: RluA family pseudouridine synthase [Anaerolineae bacterium]